MAKKMTIPGNKKNSGSSPIGSLAFFSWVLAVRGLVKAFSDRVDESLAFPRFLNRQIENALVLDL
jgi:hypothetical protein